MNVENLLDLFHINESNWVVALDNDDVDHLLASTTNLSVQEFHGESIMDAINNLNPKDLSHNNVKKALFSIRCNKSYCPMVSELTALTEFINEYLPNVDIRWGFSSLSDDADKATITAAFGY